MTDTPISRLIAATHRAHDALVSAEDNMLADLRLTHARVRVLTALAELGAPHTVSELARNLGVARQGVQRLVDDLAKDELLVFEDNPAHARAKLVCLTEAGAAAQVEAQTRRAAWFESLAAGLSPTWLEIGGELLTLLRRRSS